MKIIPVNVEISSSSGCVEIADSGTCEMWSLYCGKTLNYRNCDVGALTLNDVIRGYGIDLDNAVFKLG